MNPDQLAQVRNRRIGFIFQNFNLLARTTALENVEVPLLYNPSCPRRERKRRATEMLERVGLGDRLDHRPNQLSGGQQQRVAIARALVNRPPILLCDEPTGNLDTRTSREIMAFFRKLNETEGLTVILVTHDLEVARRARRALVLIDGEVVVDTTDFDLAAEALHRRAAGRGRRSPLPTRVTERVERHGTEAADSVWPCSAVSGCATTAEEICRNIILPEQRTIDYRDPAQLPPAPIPDNVPPRTVSDPRPGTPEWQLSLDEAIRIALENAKVVRVLAGTTAVASGQTIYDAAITNTTIDQAQARSTRWPSGTTPGAAPTRRRRFYPTPIPACDPGRQPRLRQHRRSSPARRPTAT